jgi:hypothetical protein
MSFLLKQKQFANLAFSAPGPVARPDYLKFIFCPGQTIDGFPIECPASAFPTGFANTATFPAFFDVEGYLFVPPPWKPSGWERMVHRNVTQTSANVFVFSWGPVNYQVTVTIA